MILAYINDLSPDQRRNVFVGLAQHPRVRSAADHAGVTIGEMAAILFELQPAHFFDLEIEPDGTLIDISVTAMAGTVADVVDVVSA